AIGNRATGNRQQGRQKQEQSKSKTKALTTKDTKERGSGRKHKKGLAKRNDYPGTVCNYGFGS
ncbi:MAG TPA: hypothetical protein VKE71_11035, partial [Candidatus Angelobacter sp.]|nr:hypothetical protein [Candidatus Angelobacter sp.]